MGSRRIVTTAGLTGAVALAVRRRARWATAAVPATQPLRPLPPARESTLRTEDGVPLHVAEYGAHPDDACATVVLAHGYHQSSRLWVGQVQDLLVARPDLRVLTYDHRGHGRSGRTTREAACIEQLGHDLAAVLDAAVPAGPVVLAGHSMGGMTVMALAEQRPDLLGSRVVGVAFVATSSGGLADVCFGAPALVARPAHRALARVNEVAVRAEQAGRRRVLAPGTARVIFGKGARRDDVRLVLEDMVGCSAETVAFFHATFLDHDRLHALAAIDVPAVVLCGTRDRLCPVAHSRAIADALPQPELAVFPGAGHMLQLERRLEVSRHLVELVGRTVPAGDAPVPEQPGPEPAAPEQAAPVTASAR